jgi:hypothetical protein
VTKFTETAFLPLACKWRGDVLLLAYPGWIDEDLNAVSARLVARLRKEYRENRGVISFPLLAEAAATLTEDGIRSLQTEFSVMGNVAHWRNVLAMCYTQPQAQARLRSRFGLPIDKDVAATLSTVRYSPRFTELALGGTAVTLRVEESDNDRGHSVTFGIVNDQGRWIPIEGFVQLRTDPAKESPPDSRN